MFDVKRINANEANASEENRINYVAQIATMTRGLDGSKDPQKLYNRLLTEAFNGTPGRPMEFIPVYFKVEWDERYKTYTIIENGKQVSISLEVFEEIKKYSTIGIKIPGDDYRVYDVWSNMRCLLKAGIKYEQIPYNKKTEGFMVVDMTIPMFSWAQFYTHTVISKMSESDRVSVDVIEDGFDFWLPRDFVEKFNSNMREKYEKDVLGLYDDINEEEVRLKLMNDYSQSGVRKLFSKLGYPKEIWSRAIYYFQYKRTILAGWKQDSYGWENLLNERLNGWTQGVTKEIALQLLEIYKK